jgi:xanthine dehydrogenase iron-sulfur cluster and FAD-binding subunit A
MNEMTNSHILVQEFDYLQPTSVRDAIALLTQYGDRARVLAGGTDLLVQMKMERRAPEYLIDIQKIPGLRGIEPQGDGVRIGAGTTIWTIRNDAMIRAHYPALAEACASFSTTQVQFMGTIGGNLCNGSPASDTAPVLITLDAQAVIEGADGERQLPLEEFFLGPGKTALRGDELLVAVVLQRPQPDSGSAFLKVTRVVADLAKANAAVVLVCEGDRVTACRLAFGSVAPTPLRAVKTEALLAGQLFSEGLVAEAAQAASEEVIPIDDVRSTAWYRRQAVKVMTHDALNAAWERAKGEGPSRLGQERSPAEGDHSRAAAELASELRVSATEQYPIELVVNGASRRLSVAPNELLLNVLREKLELTGSKYGCGIGECSACTVQMNGEPVLSCLVLAIAAHGSEIVTVEGLRRPGAELDPLQEAFIEHAALQCGYCTPGMLITAKSLLQENACPTEEQVRDHLKGNLCRCTGYAAIVRAVMSCAQASDETPA